MPFLLLTVHLLSVNLTKKAHEFSAKADAAQKNWFSFTLKLIPTSFLYVRSIFQTRNLIEIVSFHSIYTRMSILYCFQKRNYLETCVQHGTLSFCLTKRKDFAATINIEKTKESEKYRVCIWAYISPIKWCASQNYTYLTPSNNETTFLLAILCKLQKWCLSTQLCSFRKIASTSTIQVCKHDTCTSVQYISFHVF